MKSLRKKIKKQTEISIALRYLAFSLNYESGTELRKKQNEEWKKLKFFEKLNDAMERLNAKENEIFELEKDKPNINSDEFKKRIKDLYKYKADSNLYRRIINYQIKKYGQPLDATIQLHNEEECNKMVHNSNHRKQYKLRGRRNEK